ncbi:MAG: sel1 repeat family protein [Alphaproteobacteria bacterium]|jgi:TPR repeat protein|nr:sel1 repeat family protein [Alphaproteobacteria bacterium]MBP9877349.1 sel1 repeat family protein [Alphaproteobacteria bacterium]
MSHVLLRPVVPNETAIQSPISGESKFIKAHAYDIEFKMPFTLNKRSGAVNLEFQGLELVEQKKIFNRSVLFVENLNEIPQDITRNIFKAMSLLVPQEQLPDDLSLERRNQHQYSPSESLTILRNLRNNRALDIFFHPIIETLEAILYQSSADGIANDNKRAFILFKLAADKGYAVAQSILGTMYYSGDGVKQNLVEAARYFNLAVAQDDANAQYNLGAMYHAGEGVEQNLSEAFRLVKLAAAQGDVQAQYMIGTMYQTGRGVKRDFRKAARYYKKAADRGYVTAQYNLGTMYYNGKGYKKNMNEAARYFKLAADQGYDLAIQNLKVMYRNKQVVDPSLSENVPRIKLAADAGNVEAQFVLGTMYQTGRGVKSSLMEAVRYLQLAADQGHTEALFALIGLYRRKGNPTGASPELISHYSRLVATQMDRVAQDNIESLLRQFK